MRNSFLVAATALAGLSVLLKAAPDHPIAVGRRAGDVIAIRNLAGIARREDQELATFSLVRARIAEIGHVLEPEIVDDPQHVRRRLDHHRLVTELQPGRHVDRGRVRREPQRLGIHQRLEQHGSRVRRAERQQPLSHAVHGCDLDAVEIGLDAALEVEIVIDRLRRFGVRHAVEQRQRPEAGFQAVGRRDARWHLRRHLHFDCIAVCRRGDQCCRGQQHHERS